MLQVRYYSTWGAAILHCSVNKGAWRDVTLRQADRFGWLYGELPADTREVEFVVATADKTEWDKAPGGGNYACDVHGDILVLAYGKMAFPKKENAMMLVVDLDGTLFGHADHLKALKRHWLLHHTWSGSSLVYNTGRNMKSTLQGALAWDAPAADYLICGCGTEMYQVKPSTCAPQKGFPSWCPSPEHVEWIPGWKRIVESNFDKRKAELLMTPFVSQGVAEIHGNDDDDRFRLPTLMSTAFLLEEAGETSGAAKVEATFHGFNVVFSGDGPDQRYVDVLPTSTNKRESTIFLAGLLSCPLSQVLVCGDSGNDVDMFKHPEIRGCCVANAQSDLVDYLSNNSGDVTDHVGLERGSHSDLFRVSPLRRRNSRSHSFSQVLYGWAPCVETLIRHKLLCAQYADLRVGRPHLVTAC